MANTEHGEIVGQGAEAINKFREKNPDVRIDLSQADLSGGGLNCGNAAVGDHVSPVCEFFRHKSVKYEKLQAKLRHLLADCLPRTHGSAPRSTPLNPCVRFDRHDHIGEDHGNMHPGTRYTVGHRRVTSIDSAE